MHVSSYQLGVRNVKTCEGWAVRMTSGRWHHSEHYICTRHHPRRVMGVAGRHDVNSPCALSIGPDIWMWLLWQLMTSTRVRVACVAVGKGWLRWVWGRQVASCKGSSRQHVHAMFHKATSSIHSYSTPFCFVLYTATDAAMAVWIQIRRTRADGRTSNLAIVHHTTTAHRHSIRKTLQVHM